MLLHFQKTNKVNILKTEYRVIGLEQGLEYEFRVYAKNEAGIGKPSRASESVFCYDPIDPPETPEVVRVGKDYVDLCWEKPEYDGGSKITGYIIEKRELPSDRWLKCNFGNVIETEYRVDGLTENDKYEFRVSAKNAIGEYTANLWIICLFLNQLLW